MVTLDAQSTGRKPGFFSALRADSRPAKFFDVKSPDGATESSWYQGVSVPEYGAPPRKAARADVCVVGAGIAGLTTAYLCASEGLSVIVLDEGPVGSGQTGRTSAHLASAIDDRFVEIERMHGKDVSRLAYQSHAAAIDEIERIGKKEDINCDFVRLDGLLSSVPEDPPDLLDRELEAAKRAGFKDVEMLKSGGIDNARCIRFGKQARFHPMKYLVGVAEAFTKLGGKIGVGRRVKDVQGVDTKKKTPGWAELDNGVRITADHLVVATNTPSPINDWMGIYTKQASYRTYVVGMSIPRGSLKDALYWDTGDPYHYVRIQPARGGTSDLLLVGGEDHKTGQPVEGGAPFMRLEQWAKKTFPMVTRTRFRWSGQVQEPSDGLAFIGRALTAKEEVFVATGDSGMGLTHGTIAGMMITDLIKGRKNPWEKVYDPGRKQLNTDFVKENANVMKQYTELLTGGDVSSLDDIRPGSGAVMRDGVHKLAVYRDEKGMVHKRSAVCTHLGCIVHWNSVEKTWDCPCHGSRFDPKGKVLMGPAVDDLPPVKK
jgi:glycine/D-amino acid oxidase-like deaminating enzyme/nitrite reductase/ring-hydroxylating ferredoxin subunit